MALENNVVQCRDKRLLKNNREERFKKACEEIASKFIKEHPKVYSVRVRKFGIKDEHCPACDTINGEVLSVDYEKIEERMGVKVKVKRTEDCISNYCLNCGEIYIPKPSGDIGW